MEGLDLLRLLVESTGLPKDAVDKEMTRILTTRGLRRENLTLDQLREVLAIYLQEVLIETKSSARAEQ